MNRTDGKIVLVLSGGQDSTTCLGVAHKDNPNAEIWAITFDYGQRHRVEVEASARIVEEFNRLVSDNNNKLVKHKIVKINSLAQVADVSDLLKKNTEIKLQGEDGLPTSFVPGRNLIFLTLASIFARKIGATKVYTGVCQTDYSGYPDCRDNTIKALQVAINLGMETGIEIKTPLMWLTKAETVKLAIDTGVYPLLRYSITCYNGQVPGCGECPACKLRAKGFEEAGVPDPAMVENDEVLR